MDIITILFKC